LVGAFEPRPSSDWKGMTREQAENRVAEFHGQTVEEMSGYHDYSFGELVDVFLHACEVEDCG
jgi:hypothetical protein